MIRRCYHWGCKNTAHHQERRGFPVCCSHWTRQCDCMERSVSEMLESMRATRGEVGRKARAFLQTALEAVRAGRGRP